MESRRCSNLNVLAQCSTGVDGQPRQDGRTRGDEYLNTLAEEMGDTTELFRKLGLGEHPDFMTVWAALSEMVAFFTEPRPNSAGPGKSLRSMSQNKCRFCP